MAVEDSVAQDQLTDFIDRILRMKEEADAIASDIKEIYAEAKGAGFDKTQLGNVVSYLRKKEKDGEKLAEGEAIFGLYLDAYLTTKNRPASRTHVYARARVEEITEPQPTKAAGQVEQRAALAITGERVAATSSVENDAAEISTPITEQPDAPHPASDLTASPKLPQGQVAPIWPETANETHERASTNDEASPEVGPQAEASPSREQVAGTLADREARVEGQGASAALPTLSFADKIKRLRPNCQHPQACRSSGGKAHCGPCGRAAEAGSAV